MNDIQTQWGFIEKYYPNYHGCALIALNDDLQKIVGGEAENGSSAMYLFINEYSKNVKAVHEDLQKTTLSIYEKAVSGFIMEQQNKIAIVWSITDVIDRAALHHKISLTEEQAQNVLRNMEKKHDATVGINWDVLDFFIEEV